MNLLKDFLIKKFVIIDEKGLLVNNHIRFSAFTANSMAQFIQQIGKDKGEEYLFQLGYEAGKYAAVENIESTNLEKIPLVFRMGVLGQMLEIVGFGKFEFKHYDPEQNKALAFYKHNPVTEHATKLYKEDQMACIFYRGVFSAHAESELGLKSARIEETSCIAKGNTLCEWTINIQKREE